MTPADLGTVARKSLGGILASSLVTIVRFVAGFGSQIVLARMLAPQVFGEFAFLVLVQGFAGMFRSLKGPEYVVRLTDDQLARRYPTVWTIEVSLGVVLALATFALADPLMAALGDPDLAPYLQLLASSFVLGGLSLPASLLSRRLAFWRAQLPSLAGAVLRPGLKIAFACGGFGLWSLILGDLAGFAIELALLWIVGRAPVRLALDRDASRDLARFGLPLVLANLLTYYYWKVDDYIVARVLGLEALGYYWLAFRVPEYLFQFKIALSPVAYAALARLASVEDRRAYFESITRWTFVLAAPVALVSVLHGREWLVLLFGEAWAESAVPFQFLMVAMALRMSFGYSADLLQIAGRTGIQLAAAAMNGALLTAACIPLTVRFGIGGTGMAVAVMVLGGIPVSIWIARREVGARFVPALARSAAPLAIVAFLGLGSRRWFPPSGAAQLVSWSLLWSGLYFGLALWWEPRLRRGLRWMVGRSPGPTS